MISVFGIVSVVVALLSVAAIILHNRIMRKRTPVDTHFAELEELLRIRVEMLHDISTPGSSLQGLCDECVTLDVGSMLNALPYINTAFDCEKEAEMPSHDESPEEDEEEDFASADITVATLEENTEAINAATEALNQAINDYNSYIASSRPVTIMALILGLKAEKTIETPPVP